MNPSREPILSRSITTVTQLVFSILTVFTPSSFSRSSSVISVGKSYELIKRAFEIIFKAKNNINSYYELTQEEYTQSANEFMKENQNMTFVMGTLGNQVLSKERVEQIAKLPSKPALIGQLLSVLNGPIRGVCVALNAIAEKKEN